MSADASTVTLDRRQYWLVVHIDAACDPAMSDAEACDTITKHLGKCGGLGSFSTRSGLHFSAEAKQMDRGVVARQLDDAFQHLHLDDGQALPVVAYLDTQGQQVHPSQRFTAAHRVVAGPTVQGYMMIAYVAEVQP
jgi:hypothetical protein